VTFARGRPRDVRADSPSILTPSSRRRCRCRRRRRRPRRRRCSRCSRNDNANGRTLPAAASHGAHHDTSANVSLTLSTFQPRGPKSATLAHTRLAELRNYTKRKRTNHEDTSTESLVTSHSRKITFPLFGTHFDLTLDATLVRYSSRYASRKSLSLRNPFSRAESLEPHRRPPDNTSRTSRPARPLVDGQSDRRQLHPSQYPPPFCPRSVSFLMVPLTHPGLRTLSSARVRMTPRRENETRPSRLLT